MGACKEIEHDVVFNSLRAFIKAPTLVRDHELLVGVRIIASEILSYTQMRLLNALHEQFATPFIDLNEVAGRMLNEPVVSHLDIALLSDAFNRSMSTMRSSLIASLRNEHVLAFREFSTRLYETLREPLAVYASSIHQQQVNAMSDWVTQKVVTQKVVTQKVECAESWVHTTVDPAYYSAAAIELRSFNELRVIYADDDRARRVSLEEPVKTMGDLLELCSDQEMFSSVLVRLYVNSKDPECLIAHMVSMTNSAAHGQARVREARSAR